MKKSIFLVLAVIMIFNISAQSFKLTPTGFVDSEDETKDFIVLNFDGKLKKDIFELVNAKVVSMFISAKDVISNSGDDVLSINGVSTKAISFNAGFNYTMNYTVSLLFKDGKLRINSPSLNDISGTFGQATNHKQLLLQGAGGTMLPTQCIYNSKGDLKREKNKVELEKFFNNLILEIKKSVELPTNW